MVYKHPCSHLPFLSLLHWSERDNVKLPCGFTVKQSWVGLKKAWTGYKIAKREQDIESMIAYAKHIQRIESELGIPLNSFPHLNLLGNPLYVEGKTYKYRPWEAPSKSDFEYFEEYDNYKVEEDYYNENVDAEELVFV